MQIPSLIPKSSYQVRPRIAVEVRPEGVYAARSNDASGAIAQVARAELLPGAVAPSLRAGNIVDRIAVIAALRRVLSTLQTGKLRDVTLVVPDSAVRVLLLDFDSLPSNTEEALAVVRFRLAKLLPFSPEAAQVGYQVMGERARQLQVVAVAIPYEVLNEYESAVREAGFEPGAVLPSTLAVASAIDDAAQTAALLVNGSEHALTTAILRRGELLLHRTLDVHANAAPDHGIAFVPDAAAIALPVPPGPAGSAEYGADDRNGEQTGEGPIVEELVSAHDFAEATRNSAQASSDFAQADRERIALELLQAISVAAAYYEDSLAAAPEAILTSGTLSPSALADLLRGTGLAPRDVLQPADVLSTVTATLAPGLLAGLRGALRS